MIFNLNFSKQAEKFLKTRNVAKEEIFIIISKAVKKFRGENVNIDIKKLRGEWFGFFRIRMGKIRIIAEFDFDNQSVFIEVIDLRGNAYR
ncbi:MAG: hypothetical protein AAB781_00090 [Patescibacteria group bacterium]